MSDIENYIKRYTGQAESKSLPNPRLAEPLEVDGLVINVTSALFNED